MGYKVSRRTYKFVFPEDSSIHGVEIDVKSTTLGELRDMQEKGRLAYQSKDGPTMMLWQDEEIRLFLSYVISWNLEDESGNPLEICEKSFYTLPAVDTKDIVRTWYNNCLGTDVSAPLAPKSNDGASSVEASIPMTEV